MTTAQDKTRLFICEHCGFTVRDDFPHTSDLRHICDDGTNGTMRRHPDDRRELSPELDLTRNQGAWMG